MALDPELLKQLLESFGTELNEHIQAITKGLLLLEKNNLDSEERHKVIEVIFRSAHNIKGTSGSLGINDISLIAHPIESMFSDIKTTNVSVSPETINLCLEAIDKMGIAYNCYIEKKSLPFDMDHLIKKLTAHQSGNTQPTLKNQSSSPKKIHNKVKPKTLSKSEKKIPTETKVSHEHDSIRVPIYKIEKVSSLLEEIQVNKIAIIDHYGDFSKLLLQTKNFSSLWKQLSYAMKNHMTNAPSEMMQNLDSLINDSLAELTHNLQDMHKNIRVRTNDLTLISHSLQEEVSLLRMIPIGNLLCTFPRYVRDLSLELNKSVELFITGDDIKIDKAVLEGLKDPLIHLLRNAIDHGIESPTQREQIGKSPVGRIDISITEDVGNIKICIMDDGSGVDVNKLPTIAKIKKMLSDEELLKMTDEEKIDLIFCSGFSTKEIITNVSGRGVGLDVVKSNLEELKGHVTVSSQLGKGTKFIVSVPVSISSERGLLIKCLGQQFVIPTSSIQHVLITNAEEIVSIQGGQAIILDKKTIPLRILADILNLEAGTQINKDKISIVVIKKGSKAMAILVDEIIGEREIVIKPLQLPLVKVPCVAGGTLLDSNQVITVIAPGDLITLGLSQNKTNRLNIQSDTPLKKAKPHILVVDDSITTRTLEKTVLESRNYTVTVAVNGKEAWDILQKQKFSLLITDVNMPIMDGFTLTEQIKTHEKLRDLPVIIVTSLGSDAEKKRGIDVGADAYIVKNEFESGALLDIVSQLV